MRSHYCGDIQSSDIGAEVEISGWVHKRRDHGGVIFLDIRDLHGIVQVVFNPESKDTFDLADSCRSEFVINIKGLVRARIEGAINPKMATGEIEIEAQSLAIYSKALTPKFPLDDYQEVNEDVRLKNRFLDLRRPDINDRLIKRSQITSKIRSVLELNNFHIQNEFSIRRIFAPLLETISNFRLINTSTIEVIFTGLTTFNSTSSGDVYSIISVHKLDDLITPIFF